MLPDLQIAIAVMSLLSIGVFFLGRRFFGSLSPFQLNLAAVLALVVLGAYLSSGWYRPWLVAWLPLSSLIVLGNWLPLWAAGFAAIVDSQQGLAASRRMALAVAIFMTGTYSAIYPVLGEAPRCSNAWDKDGNCMQTTDHTCSAACAATLLHRVGITATEQEMAELCLTREGTNWQGLYRGLKLKTQGTPYDVQICSGGISELRRLESGPMIVSVGLQQFASSDTAFTREFGWVPGVNHSVIVRYFDQNGSAIIADPTQARCTESWAPETMDMLYRGVAFRLVKRR